MNERLSRLSARREQLITQAARQRIALARGIAPLRPSLTLVDQGLAAFRYIRTHPGWVVGGVILLASLRSVRGGKWLGRVWMTWQVMQAMRAS